MSAWAPGRAAPDFAGRGAGLCRWGWRVRGHGRWRLLRRRRLFLPRLIRPKAGSAEGPSPPPWGDSAPLRSRPSAARLCELEVGHPFVDGEDHVVALGELDRGIR